MHTKKPVKRLSIKLETIRLLQDKEMKTAVGGVATSICDSTLLCPTNGPGWTCKPID
jgi:hypothetical protein